MTLDNKNGGDAFTIKIKDLAIKEIPDPVPLDEGGTLPAPGMLTPTRPGSSSGDITYTVTADDPDDTEELKFTFSREVTIATGNVIITNGTGSATKSFQYGGGTGTITNGKMSFTIGATSKSLWDELKPVEIDPGMEDENEDEDAMENPYPDFTVSPGTAREVVLVMPYLEKRNLKMNYNSSTGTASVEAEQAEYIYVDRDCTMTATGKTVNGFKFPNLNLAYKQGWNTVYIKMAATSGPAGTTVTAFTMSMGETSASACKWIIDEDSAGPEPDPNAMTWTPVADSTFGTNGIYAIAYGGGKFAVVGNYGQMAYADWP